MGFADASVCPSCRGQIEHATTCPHCGLDLTSHEVQQAWQALVVADQWIERARSQQASGVPSEPSPADPAGDSSAPQHPPVAAQPPRPKRSVSAGSVLLALGAGLILVAGSIFITVSWGSLGVLGRALVLLAVTALIGRPGVVRHPARPAGVRRGGVVGVLRAADARLVRRPRPGAGRTRHLAVRVVGGRVGPAGDRRRPRGGADWVVGDLSKELLAPSIVAGVASWFAAGSLAAELADEIEGTEFWPAVLATAVATVAALVLRRGAVRVGSWISFAGAAFFGLFAIGFAVAEAVEHPSLRDLVVDAHGLPLLVVVVAAVGRRRAGRAHPVGRLGDRRGGSRDAGQPADRGRLARARWVPGRGRPRGRGSVDHRAGERLVPRRPPDRGRGNRPGSRSRRPRGSEGCWRSPPKVPRRTAPTTSSPVSARTMHPRSDRGGSPSS